MDISDIFTKEHEWDWGLILSYDLEPFYFFETELLNKIKIKKNLTIVIDEFRYKKMMRNPNFRLNHVGVYYNIEKVQIKKGGQFHPKLYFFLSDEQLILATGSANLTATGFKRNLECLVILNFRKNNLDLDDIGLVLQVKDFLTKSFMKRNEIVATVSMALKKIISEILNSQFFKFVVEESIRRNYNPKDNKYYFLDSIETSLFSQIKNILGEDFNKVHILSPFFDNDDSAFKSINKVSKKIEVFIPSQNNTFPKEAMKRKFLKNKKFAFFLADKIESSKDRFIHAKYYRFKKNRDIMDLITSANFTNSGLLNDLFPRNFEIGLLFPAGRDKFLDNANLAIDKIENFDSVYPDEDKTSDELHDEKKLYIESAVYDRGKIHISFYKYFLRDYDLDDFEIELLLDGDLDGKYSIFKNKKDYYIEPSLEIEGDQLIQIQLMTEIVENFESFSVFVNRLRHSPNYLPSLGASAFSRCVRIGGIEGIKRAFVLAKNSGRKDWLVYLLSHWNLEKILLGINKERIIKDSQEEETDEPDLIPHLPPKKKGPRRKIPTKNFDSAINNINLCGNLASYLSGIDNMSKNIKQKTINYIESCFPFFLQVAQYFLRILEREEQRKAQSSGIEYPEYTWLENYNENHDFLMLIYEKLKVILSETGYAKFKDEGDYYHLLALAYLWTTIHTKKTLDEFKARYENISELSMSIKNRMKNFIDKVSNNLLEKIVEEYEYYNVNPEFLLS